MKTLIFVLGSLFTILTVVQPVQAQDASTLRTSSDESYTPRLSDLGMHINPQLGVSSFEYSGAGGQAHTRLSGGSTIEFGEGARILELGALLIQTGGSANLANGTTEQINASYLTLPMMAKLRILHMKSQSWYAKVGFMTAFQTGSSDRSLTNPIDVLGSVGIAGRFPFTKSADFIIEATYNHGMLDAVQSSSNEGYLILAGLSFRL